jgi:sigma54-dependent transcription regulator
LKARPLFEASAQEHANVNVADRLKGILA